MLTRNYYHAIAAMAIGAKIANGLTLLDGSKSDCYQASDSSKKGSQYSHLSIGCGSLGTSATNSGFVFGNGAVEPTIDDYCLSGEFIKLSGTLQRIVATLTNRKDTDVTISEVGYQDYVYVNSSGSKCCLLERTLLDNPITIPAGGVGQVTYTVRMSLPA